MIQKHEGASTRGLLLFIVVLINVIIIKVGFTADPKWYYLLLISLPLLALISPSFNKIHMQSIEQPIILREDDYQVLISFLKDRRYAGREDARLVTDLELEIRKATLVTKDQFPRDVVRLNSRIRIIDADRDAMMDLTLVTPDKADIKARKISVLAPIGTALLGLKKGTTISWEVPGGKKEFTVMEVTSES